MQCSDTSAESDVAIKHQDSDSHGVSALVGTDAIMHCPLNVLLSVVAAVDCGPLVQ